MSVGKNKLFSNILTLVKDSYIQNNLLESLLKKIIKSLCSYICFLVISASPNCQVSPGLWKNFVRLIEAPNLRK